MSEYTPGPWKEGVEGNLRVYGPDNANEHSGLIATVYKGRGNVRLIAAAPDLLEALILLLREMELSGNAGSKDYGWPKAITTSRVAIAKATESSDEDVKR